MSLITRMRRQTATYWARSATPDRFGKYSYEAPVEIDCRWDDSTKQFRDAQGELAFSQATVYVDRDMQLGDRLKQGSMPTDATEDPFEYDDTYEIKGVDKNPNIKATEYLRTVYL